MKTRSLKRQITGFFLLICLFPIVLGTVFLFERYRKMLQAEALNDLTAKERAARLMYQEQEKEMQNMAQAYARQKAYAFLIPFNLGFKIGVELDRLSAMDNLDQVMIINNQNEVLARSRFPDKTRDILAARPYLEWARAGMACGFTEVLSDEELKKEGCYDPRDLHETEGIISVTGVAPMKAADSDQIVAVVLVRRFIRNNSSLIRNISRSLTVHAALYRNPRAGVQIRHTGLPHPFFPPAPDRIQSVFSSGRSAQISRLDMDGELSCLSPIPDYVNRTVAVLALQADMTGYIRSWNLAMTGLCAVLILAGIMVWVFLRFMATHIFGPLEQLKCLTQTIAAGQKPAPLTIQSRDEIGDLTGAFNRMALQLAATHQSLEKEIQKTCESEKALKQAYDELEIRVAERTGELSRTNESLEQEIQERRRAEEQVKESLVEKDLLIKEIHHRVKNNLQIVSSLLDMSQSRSDIPQVIDALSGARSKIHTMALIHTQLYQSDRFDRIDMESNIQSLCESLSQMYGLRGLVRQHIDAADTQLPIALAIPCALVLNELISNSYKHAFQGKDSGNIWISMKIENDSAHIDVRDDGIGIPETLDIMTVTSLGIKLIRNLILRQLKGNFTISRENGTLVRFSFPLHIT